MSLCLDLVHLLIIFHCHHLVPLSTLHHLLHDIESTHQFAVNNDLRECY